MIFQITKYQFCKTASFTAFQHDNCTVRNPLNKMGGVCPKGQSSPISAVKAGETAGVSPLSALLED